MVTHKNSFKWVELDLGLGFWLETGNYTEKEKCREENGVGLIERNWVF